jgi:hypothetical protein
MVFNLSDEIRNCHVRATEYRERANKEHDSALKELLNDLAQRWLNLAQSYEITARLSQEVDERTAGRTALNLRPSRTHQPPR